MANEKSFFEFKVKSTLDSRRITERFKAKINTAQEKLDAQIIKDSNYYCPLKTGTLQKSAIINTKIGSGLIVWKTPYARSQYYGNFDHSKQANPNATAKWFESAKAQKLKQWLELFKRSL